ncbi:DeoR/GlpR family DNA-binding transcription regulator [Lentzea sp. NPDC051213]|uniref:DeoR/GlpR family DNA-binding transcription regulator n=1 Tax=Lentzea sp. NPDC051213 TaxID=3364126 RepID=UPI00378DC8FC
MTRLRQITEAVRDAGSLGVAELASLTGASEMTIRRDLETLAAQGVLERFRGGARSLLLRGSEPPFALRTDENLTAKRRIATAVASLLADGESVVLDSGTTCLEIARLLHDRRMTVMPLSLHSVNALSSSPSLTLLVPGGRPRAGELALTGPLTLASITALRFDTAVIGCCGLSAEHGMTAFDLEDASVKRAAIASARRVIAAVDASKLTRTALAFVAPVSSLDAVVTDAEDTADLEEAGVTVVTA